MIAHCCETLGVEETCARLQIPTAFGDYLTGSNNERKPEATDTAYDQKQIEILDLPEEDKQRIVQMYLKGIRIPYIATLYGITNGKVINSWGDWRKRPPMEGRKFLERRAHLQKLLAQGMSVKEARAVYKITNKVFREIMGIPRRDPFPIEVYEQVIEMLQQGKSANDITEVTGVPLYLIRKWESGKGIPHRPVLVDDQEGTADLKAAAIKLFYETGDAQKAADALGIDSKELIERWTLEFQTIVSSQETRL